MNNSKKEITVGFLWHSLGSGNLGVGALTESNIAIVRSAAEKLNIKVNFLVLGTSDQSIPELADELNQAGHTLECHRVRVFRKSYRDLIKRCDFVLDIGEGDSFADIYGFKRFLYHWLGKNIVCHLKKPLILSPQTIGPFDGRLTRFMAKQIMWRCKKIFARDQLSYEYLQSLGIVSNIGIAIDVAFCLPFNLSEKYTSKPKVGINVSGLLFNGGYTGNNQFGLSADYPRIIRELISYFIEVCDAEVYLVSHVIEPGMATEDDYSTCQLLASEFPEAKISPIFSRPSEAKSFIAGMDFFTGARMHACIAAYSAGVPVIPMAYSRKFNGLFGTLGFSHVADLKKESLSALINKVKEGYSQRGELKELILNSQPLIEERLAIYRGSIKETLMETIDHV